MSRTTFWLRNCEPLEQRLCLTAVEFLPRFVAEFEPEHAPDQGWLVDLDQDGNMEIVLGNATGLRSYEYSGGRSMPGKTLVETANLRVRDSVFVDMDQDGDLDINTVYDNGRWVWFPQEDDGSFGQPNSTLGSHQFADLDGDGDLDGIALLEHGEGNAGRFVWFETTGNELGIGPQHALAVPVTGRDSTDPAIVPQVVPTDIDMDGDLDLLALPGYNRHFHWLRNLDGQGTYGPAIRVTSWLRHSVAADFDNDGDLDVMNANNDGIMYVQWIRNDNDSWSRLGSRVPDQSGYPTLLHAADLSGDGRLDLILQSIGDTSLHWHQQLSGEAAGYFGPVISLDPTDAEQFGAYRLLDSGDFDGDGDVDLLVTQARVDASAVTKVYWLESQLVQSPPTPGDINRDARVTFEDFLVLSANFGSSDAVRADGDLNGDGRVGFADFLLLSANYTAEIQELQR